MINKLCLGTVQLGMKYGIKNEINRQPTCQESLAVLETAINSKIKYYDTASVYGNAEEILGKFNIGSYDVNVVSKLRPNISFDEVATVQKEVRKSILRLNIDVIDGYILHDAKDFYNQGIMNGLQTCKEKGLVRNIGVSIYGIQDAINVVRSGLVDYIQIPYSVFDQRLNETDFFYIAAKNSVRIFARSAFLQGLLLMNIKDLPSKLLEVKPYLEKFECIVSDYGLTRYEAAFLFSYCNEAIDQLVFGVDTKEQLLNNCSLVQKADNFKECYTALYRNFKDINLNIINPSMW